MTKPPFGPGCAAPAQEPCGNQRQTRARLTPTQRQEAGEGPINKHWRTYFLQALAETSNVRLSAEKADISPSRAYKARRDEPDFAAHWRVALNEGYQNLEMEVLAYLRGTEPERKLDVANAVRLLAAHRDTVAHERATLDSRDERAVLDSIDAMIDEMRSRAAANARITAEDGGECGGEESDREGGGDAGG